MVKVVLEGRSLLAISCEAHLCKWFFFAFFFFHSNFLPFISYTSQKHYVAALSGGLLRAILSVI